MTDCKKQYHVVVLCLRTGCSCGSAGKWRCISTYDDEASAEDHALKSISRKDESLELEFMIVERPVPR